MTDIETAVVGAGPYGLAAVAHLRRNGGDVMAFGEPMSFWSTQMPVGMLLRSPYVACTIGNPDRSLDLPAYERAVGAEKQTPVPLSHFVDYGRWFQQQIAPDLNPERIAEVEQNGKGYWVTLADGERVHAKRVVVAAGIGDFASYPAPFSEMPRELVSHASEEGDLSQFSGRRVIVVGAGQTALESAAILSEAGAEVEVLIRDADVHFLVRRWHHKLGPISRLLYAPPDVGPMGISWCVALPPLFSRLPRQTQAWMSRRALRPAGAGWLPTRLADVTITTGVSAASCRELGDRIELKLSDGSTREADHVLLGTGYRVDVSRYAFLGRALVSRLKLVDGYPVLRKGFESNLDGLHFMGAPAAYSYGPLMRFVAGTPFAGKELGRATKARRRRWVAA